MTKLQENKYWREWSQACRVQGWKTGAEKDHWRKLWHEKLKLPDSHKHWSHAHFSRWISGTAHLRNVVDIRDRERESPIWTIERLRAAFKILLGHDYARAIMVMWADSDDLDKFPLQSASMLDLENLRNTLKNRIGRVIQRIKSGEMEPGPDCPALGDIPQAEIIESLINQKPVAARPARKTYALDGSKTFQSAPLVPVPVPTVRRTPAPKPPTASAAPAAAPAPAGEKRQYCMHSAPKKFIPQTKPQHIESHAESHAEPDPY